MINSSLVLTTEGGIEEEVYPSNQSNETRIVFFATLSHNNVYTYSLRASGDTRIPENLTLSDKRVFCECIVLWLGEEGGGGGREIQNKTP